MKNGLIHGPAAYATWLVMVFIAATALLLIITTPQPPTTAVAPWFTVPVLWLMFAVPGAVLLHGHGFLTAERPAPTDADAYTALAAARSVWGVLTLGVVLALVAARVSGSASPSVWPGTVMFMLLVLARPSRSA